MIRFLRRYRKPFVSLMVLLHVSQLVNIPRAFALTSGPTQPEVQGFQPAGTTEMVDLFTGDFGYNIPLFELPGPNGGYPFNLSYQSGIGMDAEASWVGLGWSLTPGAINRQMRGLPDEFKGEPVDTKMSIAPSVTVGAGAGVSIEFFGADGAKVGPAVGFGFSVYRNNFRGIGHSIDGSVGFKTAATKSGVSGNVGLNMSIDSQEGVGISPQLGLDTKTGSIGLRAAYNSESGLSAISASFERPTQAKFTRTVGRTTDANGTVHAVQKEGKFKFSNRGGASFSLAHPGYTPQVNMPMENLNLGVSFAAGTGWWGVHPKVDINGFYNEQRLKNDKKWVRTGAYGYLNLQHGDADKHILDFNREKDGMVSKETPNLPIPSMTYDIYSVTGQGISAMYRPMRNDAGVLNDPRTESTSIAATGGVDIGTPATYGVNLSLNHSRSVSGAWEEGNNVRGAIGFQDKLRNDLYEPWYFRAHGEGSVSSGQIEADRGDARAVRVELSGENVAPVAEAKLEDGETWSKEMSTTPKRGQGRNARNQVIQVFTNEQILRGKDELLPLFRVQYRAGNGNSDTTKFDRSTLPVHHTAGLTALTPEGLRYVYGIPAYNTAQEEVVFSAQKDLSDPLKALVSGNSTSGDPKFDHKDTDKFLKRTKMPGYAHAYLLTAIVGPDYVDVTGNGVTEDDLGYWVKFTYQRTADKNGPYQWRDPYMKAHLQEGWKTDPGDDRGSYVYGKKELWYLVRAETKSHIADFTLRDRPDGRGVVSSIQDSKQLGKAVKGLDHISLYTRAAGSGHPLKVVRFKYEATLCPNVYNSTAGKLTLKELWFEYGATTRGRLNPYVFDYHETNTAENPAYSPYAYDRWGNYKPVQATDPFFNVDFPYTPQMPEQTVDIHSHAAVWSLKEIRLPSGGKVIVDYESDDYAYVQHKPTMQMMEVLGNDNASVGEVELLDLDRQIRFKLEQEISGTLSAQQQRDVVLRYLDQVRKQVYFKININLRDPSQDKFEYVSGYADVDFDNLQTMGLEKVGEKYVYGYFSLKAEQGKYHPFSMRAWQHVRTNQPELTTKFNERLNPASSFGDRVNQIKGLGGLVDQVRRVFEGYYNYCSVERMGREMKLGRSWIRLNSPDKKKYGGGLRVRQITMSDQWQHNQEGVYGQVYEYTTQENGEVISSGVAAYEPMAGGDENSIRHAKRYTQSIPLRSDNNLFFEYPINETYYPGPTVGYRKVTVSSLAAAALARKPVLHSQGVFPQGDNVSFGTSGITVHEFYTAKDFPVIASETGKKDKAFNMSVSIPFLGSISASKLTSSQGYSIVTNDMHGKLYRMSSYRQDPQGKPEETAMSWVEHRYASDTIYYESERVAVLRNTMVDLGDGILRLSKSGEQVAPENAHTLGEETDFIVDMRQFESITAGGGANFNLDAVYLLFGFVPIPTGWPNVASSLTQLRTAATNKIIFRAGIPVSTEAYDGGSRVVTHNLKWSKATGALILTSVNNDFNDPVYSYTIPAFTQYAGMGQAYQNAGLTLEIDNVDNLPYHDNYYQFTTASSNVLMPGDELLLYTQGSDATKPVARAVYTGQEQGDRLLYAPAPLTADGYEALIVRSGYRNQLSVAAGTVTALKDPSIGEATKTYTRTLTLPRP